MGKRLEKIRKYIKPFIVIFLIYSISMLSIWRSGVSFGDDHGREVFGYAWTSDFNRFASTGFGLLINMNDKLLDISPWSQIIGVVLLCLTSLIITYKLCGKKIKYLPLILTAFIGLFPLSIECWLYKFDAPTIAFSVFVSVLPILWWKRKMSKKSALKFGVISTICVLLMWMSYQASSGIFPIMCLALTLKDYLNGKNLKHTLKSLAIAVGAFLAGTFIYKFVLPEPPASYRSNDMFPIAELIPGIIKNFIETCSLVRASLNLLQKVLILVVIVCVAILLICRYKKRSVAAFLSLAIFLPLSMGAFLLLERHPTAPRSMMAIGFTIVPVLVLISKKLSKKWEYILIAPSVALLYSFMVFALALGNGLADQERWADYRSSELASDLSELYPEEGKKIILSGTIGYPPIMQHVINEYPVTAMIIEAQQTGLSRTYWGSSKIRGNYGLNLNIDLDTPYEESCGRKGANKVKETRHYSIREIDEFACVDLK